MPFKLRLISEFQKNVRSIKKENPSETQQEEERQSQALVKVKAKSKKRLVDKNYNFFQLVYKGEPILHHHVVNFYNIIGLNEKAIIDPDFEQSKFSTIFYIKNAKKVEIKPNYITLQLCNAPLSFSPIQYIIERYKSLGDARFYQLALLLQEASQKIKSINQMVVTENVDDNQEFFDKFVDGLGNRMFVCRSTANRLVISKSLLTLLEYDPEEMAIEIVKYKAPLFQIFSSERYFQIIVKMIQNLKNLFDLINDKISLQTFLNSSLIRFKDYVITKNHKKIYCKLKVGMPNPILNLIEVEEIINKSEELDIHSLNNSLKRMKFQEVQNKREIAEINTIRRILPLPKNLLPENKTKVANYSIKPEESKQDSMMVDQ